MENNYLLVVCAHVDSEIKKDFIIESLLKLKEENIDVCFSTHTPMYLDEISKLVKYVVYDSNNDIINRSDFIENSDLIDSVELSCSDVFNSNMVTFYHDNFSIFDNIPTGPHSRSALSLFKNGLSISLSNSYKWVIYLEYDIITPKHGFKNFIEKRINLLEKLNKKCFYYSHDIANFIWSGFFICDTETISKNKFFLNDWNNKRNWVKYWKLGFFESILEYIFKECYLIDEIENKLITEDFYDEWDVESYHNLNKFLFHESYRDIDFSLKKNLTIGIYPSYNNTHYDLYIYIFNENMFELNIKNIFIKSESDILLNIDILLIYSRCWYTQLIPILDYSKNLYFTYEIVKDDKSVLYSENFNLMNIKNVYDNLSRIKFN